jgi:hypothetical protein
MARPAIGREWKNVPDAECQTGGFVEFLIATNWLVLQLVGANKHVHAKRVVEIRDASPPGWPLLRARVEECARCGVPDGGLRRISDRETNWLVLQLGGRSTYTQNG